ncbi:MAG: DUF692 family protein [Candidatus Adiutrix sp.]|jgi:hypothetical protein|nr:DUF692 family protein [Candidatus Adiutrix sp.]
MPEAGLVISHLFSKPSRAGRRLTEAAALWSLRPRLAPAWLAGLDKRRSFHWDLGPVEADFPAAFRREGLDRFLAETEVELFSFDLGPAARRHVGPLPRSRPLGPAALRRHTEAALKLVRRHYRGPLAAENYNHYPTGLYGPVTDPDFIRAYLTEFDLGLVLDLAHARVTAHNLGLDPAAYLAALPLERTAEVHLSRPWLPPARSRLWAVDAHEAPGEEEWLLLKKIFEPDMLPWGTPVFVEYYGRLAKLGQAQARLNELLAGLTPAARAHAGLKPVTNGWRP